MVVAGAGDDTRCPAARCSLPRRRSAAVAYGGRAHPASGRVGRRPRRANRRRDRLQLHRGDRSARLARRAVASGCDRPHVRRHRSARCGLVGGGVRGGDLGGRLLLSAVATSWLFELFQGNTTGTYWQGRYSLPLLVGVPLLLGLARIPDRCRFPRGLVRRRHRPRRAQRRGVGRRTALGGRQRRIDDAVGLGHDPFARCRPSWCSPPWPPCRRAGGDAVADRRAGRRWVTPPSTVRD